MRADRVDLVIDRLVVEGLALPAGGAEALARRVEQELRRLAAAGVPPRHRQVTLAEAKPLALGESSDTRALARALAERIAAEAGITTPGTPGSRPGGGG